MSDELRKSWRQHWDFATPLYLNHGSFGLTPRVINELKTKIEAELHRDRDYHFWFKNDAMMEQARLAVAKFVHSPADDLVLVDQVTEAINSILKSLDFKPGDEIIITNHGYPPYQFLYEEFSKRTGVKFVIAQIPFPVGDTDIVETIAAKVSKRTKLAIIDHITSPTALVMPIAAIVKALKDKGVDTLVDGAHGIGQVPLDMQALGAAYYTSNCHKWLCSPPPTGFLYIRPDRQEGIIPAIGSLWSDTGHKFTERFAWQGTKDPCGRLCLPETIKFIGGLHPDGWPGIYERNHALALAARTLLSERLGLIPPCPDDMVGSMFSLPMGQLRFDPELEKLAPHMRLSTLMRKRFGYGVHAVWWGEQYLLRVTAQLYCSLNDYEKMAGDLGPVLRELKGA